jgi:hypothetical protein
MAENLLAKIDDINLKGIFLVLAHGNMAHLKKRANMRLMHKLSLKGLKVLKEEKESVKD